MAWVSLHNILQPDKNMYGTIPHTATVLVTPGTFTKGKFIDIRDCLTLCNRKARKDFERLEKLKGKPLTLAQFIKRFSVFAGDIEWVFGQSGHFTHFSDGLYDKRSLNKSLKKRLKIGDNPFGFMAYCQLDLNPWLYEQPRTTIEAIAQHVFFGHVYEKGDELKLNTAKREWIEKYAN